MDVDIERLLPIGSDDDVVELEVGWPVDAQVEPQRAPPRRRALP
jgi:hypothetical protein